MKCSRWYRLCALMMALCLLLALTGCSKPEKESLGISGQDPSPIETLAANAVTAIHAQDVDGLLDLIDPTLSDPARVALEFMQAMGSTAEEILATVLEAVLGEDAPQNVAGFCQSLELDVESIDERDSEATVIAAYRVAYEGQTYTGTATIGCVNRDGRWYLTSIVL